MLCRMFLGLRAGLAAVASCSLLAPVMALTSILPGGTLAYAIFEVAFFLRTSSKRRQLDAMAGPPLRVDQASQVFALTLKAITRDTGVGMRSWLKQWFKGVEDISAIGKDDVESLLAATIWGGSR